jgi:hypothetical protein
MAPDERYYMRSRKKELSHGGCLKAEAKLERERIE